jgi:hypothetical protein
MFNSIFETVIKGSNTIFLDLSEEDYKLSYDSVSIESAQDLIETYFKDKGKDGMPKVKDIKLNSSTHNIEITAVVNQNTDNHIKPYKVPDTLNINRKND